MDKELQKKLITEIMQEDKKDGLYKQQTAVEWLIRNVNENIVPLYIPKEVVERAKEMERKQIEAEVNNVHEYYKRKK